MCEPISIMMGLGALVGAGGSIIQGMNANTQSKDQAKLLRRQGRLEEVAGHHEAATVRREQDLLQGRATASFAKAGVMGETVADVGLSSDLEYERRVDAIRWGSQIKRENYNIKADLARKEGKAAKTAGFINAASSIISAGVGIGNSDTPTGTFLRSSFAT